MFYNVLKAKDIVDYKKLSLDIEELMQDGESSLSVVALQKHEQMDTYTSKQNTAIYVIEGEVELHLDAEKFAIDKEEILMFKKEKEYKILAKKDSKFMVIKI